jgi:hypothetical protein
MPFTSFEFEIVWSATSVVMIVALVTGLHSRASSSEWRGDDWEYGFVRAYATATVRARRVRVNVVTEVFAFCRRRDRPTSIIAQAQDSTREMLSAMYGARYEITHSSLRAFATKEAAQVIRRSELSDRRFAAVLSVKFSRSRDVERC